MGAELPPYIGRHVHALIAVECVECYRLSIGSWPGWGAYRTDEPGTLATPELAFYCPDCRREQFENT